MERLTEKSFVVPNNTFCFCQICGKGSIADICEYTMYLEMDDNNVPEPGNFFVVCKSKECNKILDNHPRGYQEVPWSLGGPGAFMLTCGDCKYRQGFTCTNPNLTANGGSGLEVHFRNMVMDNVIVCFNDGRGCRKLLGERPVVSCAGNPK
jgi:hypothetical protein